MNLLARAMRGLMQARGVTGTFCVSCDDAFYEWEGMRFAYSYSNLGVAGDLDAGGTTEEKTRDKLREILGSKSVFYDIGAHEGLYSISIKKHLPGLIVHAFEPQADALLKNLALNNMLDVQVHSVAVGDRDGSVSMTINKRSSNHVDADHGSIPMIAIDGLDISPPSVMKLDIEGFELHALRGAREILVKHKPIIITEINHCFLRYNATLLPFYEFMNSVGYSMFALRGSTLTQLDRAAKLPQDLPHSDDANYWWMPDTN
jgi:FkbM family methyltransferase